MQFACPDCTSPFEVADVSLLPRQAVELDCPGCRRAILLVPTDRDSWRLETFEPGQELAPAPEAANANAQGNNAPSNARPSATAPISAGPTPSSPVGVQPAAVQALAAIPPQRTKSGAISSVDTKGSLDAKTTPLADLQAKDGGVSPAFAPRQRPQSATFFRDLGNVQLQLPAAAARKPPLPLNNKWQEFSMMFRLDQQKKGRKTTLIWTVVALLVLGSVAGGLWLQLQKNDGREELKIMRNELSAFTINYTTSDADSQSPGTVLSRKIAVTLQVAHPLPTLPIPAIGEANSATPTNLANSATGTTGNGSANSGQDLIGRLEHVCKSTQNEVIACAHRYLVPRPLHVRFIVNNKGRAEGVRVPGGGDQHNGFQACVARAMHAVELGKQAVELRYTCNIQ